MKAEWLNYTVLRAASLRAPASQRAEWLKEWRSELWYMPRRRATRFCLGAFRDALWLRSNHLKTAERTGIYLKSPLSCLVFLTILAVASCLIIIRLPGPLFGRC